ncbi:MAG: alpha/beta hydrolase-fold protein, partial [Rubrobacteraceae bacterium]
GADGRGIAGLSEGGFGAANLGLKNRAEFGVIGSFSGYFKMFPEDAKQLDSNDTRMLIQENSPALYLPNLRGKMPAFYLFVGEQDKDFLESEKQFAGQLSSLHVTHEFHTYPGKHAWSLWEKHLSGFFIFASAHLE